ncbi:MAG: cyclic nucleotide-binding domain-containing protein, partial [Pseudomonadales bacterium]|nr:cyclic nucleotide-binding domain-containing protein [Pseudomonadales bacterium]
MKITELKSVSRDKLDSLLMTIPFFKEVKNSTEPWQYDVLCKYSRIVSYEPGEMVLARGDVDTWMYYVLKGQLVVYAGDPGEKGKAVNYITPGEIFGDLAMLVDGKRMATVLADENSREILVFGTDFSVFGKLDDFSSISLKTKLSFFRKMVHSIRWKLEQYRMEHPTHELVPKIRQMKPYTGPKDGREELGALYQQSG